MPKSISLLMLLLALFSCPVLVSCASSSVIIQDSPGITVTPRPVCLGESFIIHIPIENSGDAAFNGLVYTYLSPPGQGPQIWKDSISLSPGETKDHQVLVSRMQSRSEYVGEWEVVAEIKRSGASLSSGNIDSSTFSFSINDCTNCKGTISGYVRDSQTGEGISEATLSCEGSLCGDAISREDGYYEFVSCLCPSTTYNVECSKEDYKSASMSVTTDRAGNAVEGILLEAEGMRGGLERSWAALDLSETFDDFSDDSDLWIYAGDAYRDSDNEYVVLTENKNDQAGVVWFKAGVEAPFVAEFKYKAGGGSGADGLVFMFNKQFETYSAHRGGSLGFWGSGYGVEFDNYLDAHNSDPSANHIALVKDGTDNHLIAFNDRRTEDNKWHDVKVSVETSGATIFVDDEEVLNWSEEINCTYDRIGFSAGT